ncbi:MAG: tRNA (N6-threonylcarbamoyladenosine(37)-N6)-methyltransferase TrmO [Thermoprotei archaeon ex4572_64]|nr:MAG: tRNA (N6-threonylcarbamoyladenosine(37)-N6)-methyltransferase TrmO [Thermoprotei archaeon ex4572_64]
MKITLEPIGYVKTRYSDEEIKELGFVDAEIVILDEYVEGLKGIEEYSHIIVTYYMHRVSDDCKKVLKVKPRGLARRYGISLDELPELGVFATASPCRPNPIGITVVELLGVEKNILRVRGLDAFNETPVLDIKPYTEDKCVRSFKLPRWIEELRQRRS